MSFLKSMHTTLFVLFLGFFTLVTSNKTKIPLGCHLLEDPSNPASWNCGPYNAFKLAIEEINNSTDILPEYEIELTCNVSWYNIQAGSRIGIWHVNRGSVAILGLPFSNEAVPISYIAGSTMLPLVSFSATAAALNNPTNYPSFHRVIPSDNAQIGILASLCKHFGWQNVVIVYETTDYGRSFNEAMTKLHQKDITFYSMPVPPISTVPEEYVAVAAEFRRTGQKVLELDIRVVFIMHNWCDGVIFEFSKIPGLTTSGDFTYIINQDTGTNYTGVNVSGYYNETYIRKHWAGVFSLQTQPAVSAKTPQLLALPGGWMGPAYMQRSYDAVFVVAKAIDALTQGWTNGSLPTNAQVVKQIREQIFEGASGTVRFCGSDRLPLNWTIFNLPAGEAVMRPVFTAYTEPVCPDPDSYAHYEMEPTPNPPIFANGLTTVPRDKQYPVVKGLKPGSVAASLALIFIGITVVVISFILIHVNARTKVIKGSSVVFCNLILLGVLIALIGLLVETLYDRSQAYACMLTPGLLALSFDVTFGSLFAKTWRLVKIFQNAQHLKRSVISNAQVFFPVFVLIMLDALIIVLWAGLDQPIVSHQLSPVDKYVLFERCEMQQKTAWFSLLILPKLGVLIYGMQISYQVRNIDKTFRESNTIAVAIISLFLCGAITTPILILVWQQIDAAQILLTIGVTLALVSVALVLFVPKFWRIYSHEQDPESLDKSTTLDMSTMSHTPRSWKPDSRGGGGNGSRGDGSRGGGGSRGANSTASTAEEFAILKSPSSEELNRLKSSSVVVEEQQTPTKHPVADETTPPNSGRSLPPIADETDGMYVS